MGKAPAVETALLMFIQHSRGNKAPLSGELLRLKASAFTAQLHDETFKTTNGWFDRFCRRNNLVCGAVDGDIGDADQAACDKWVEETWPTLMKDYASDMIFYGDETGL